MRNENDNIIDDEADDEAESRARYGDAFPEVHKQEDERPLDYRYIRTLSDEDLTGLDFYRFDNLFVARSANGWLGEAAARPPQRPLFGDFWNEGELSIMFADTGRGKSILAVQIAESIASGVAIKPFKLATPAQRVLLFDFELDERQFGLRYSAKGIGRLKKRVYYKFSANLIRATFGLAEDIPPQFPTYSDFLASSVSELIEFTGAKVVIIDNITWLNSSTQNFTAALRLMKALKGIKADFGLSLLVLAHTPKRYNRSPLTVNDLQGSKTLANFADNIFAMGESRLRPDLRYLKHLKLRNAAVRHDASNVCTMLLGKMPGINPPDKTPPLRAKAPANSPPYEGGVDAALGGRGGSPSSADHRQLTTDNCFLGFSFTGCDNERDHIGWTGAQLDPDRSALTRRANQLAATGKTQREIAKTLGLSPSTVNRYLRS